MHSHLFAKSWDRKQTPIPPVESRLLPHLRAVQAAGETIVDCRGNTILENLKLDPSIWFSRLRVAVSLACLTHDLGKANSYFQGMVVGDPNFHAISQPIRHELVTTLILLRNSGGVADWLLDRISNAGLADVTEELFQVIVGATAGHHVKMDCDWKKAFPAPNQGGGGDHLTLYLNHPDLSPLFGERQAAETEVWSLIDKEPTYPGKTSQPFKQKNVEWKDHLVATPEWWRFAAAVKALTAAADVAGSALLPKGVGIKSWVKDSLSRASSPQQLDLVVSERLEGRTLRQFQQAIADSTARITLVEAGCGSGKTAAAYAWAAKRSRGRKLFFCYPTTGTATEGFLDYVHESKVEADLIHSRATVDLQRLASTPDQETNDESLRVASLAAWWPEVVVCTIDTVLAMVRNNRLGLNISPAILSSAFVFDEIHAYDDEMLAAMIAIIQALPGAPLLLMSASLPAARKALLQKELNDIAEVPSPAKLEEIPRYCIERVTDADQAFKQMSEYVCAEKRVLWVCNTVARAQTIFDRTRLAGLPAATYHSRFKYQHRVERHRYVVDSFNAEPAVGLLAVTTQVAEMSLDLDADLLVTELAPISALIQRLGRLNRRVTEDDPGTPRTALVLTPESESPYKTEQLRTADDWLDRLLDLGRPLSQQDLAEQFRGQSDATPPRPELRTEWLDSGWCALPGSVREPGFSVTVILQEDTAACRNDKQELIKRSIPVLYRKGMEQWPKLHGTLIAPPDFIHYDSLKGGSWAD